MNLRSPVRFAIRAAAFALAWAGFIYARHARSTLVSLSVGGFKFIRLVWLLLLADLVLALADPRRWRSFPPDGVPYAPEAQADLRRKDRRIVVWALLVWAVLLAGGASVLALTPLDGEAAALAVVSLLPVEAVFVRWRCPFRRWLTHSRCCSDCRLRDWGEAMILSPLAAIPSFWTAGLIALSLAILARGELLRRRTPALLGGGTAGAVCCAVCTGRCGRRDETIRLRFSGRRHPS
jgi:hypothetical protein